MKSNMSLTIAWLYPDLMSTYGDRGNILCLTQRCEWRKIQVQIRPIFLDSHVDELHGCDMIFAGGAQDRQQQIIEKDLRENKGDVIRTAIEHNVPGLYICAAYQLFGHSYQPAEGKTMEGLHIFDVTTRHFGKQKSRCIGNIVAELPTEMFSDAPRHITIVGFENHGGRTYLGSGVTALARVIVGYGNNGEDRTDGFRYKNAIGNYFHGPILPKNPHLADWLIQKALEVKYCTTVKLTPLADELEWLAHEFAIKKFSGDK